MRIFSIMHGNFLILYSVLDRNSVHLLKYSCFIYLNHLCFGGGGECYQENMNLAESCGCLKPLFYHGWNIYHGHSFLWFLIELLYVFPLSCNWLPLPPFCPLSTWKLRETSDVLEEVSPHGTAGLWEGGYFKHWLETLDMWHWGASFSLDLGLFDPALGPWMVAAGDLWCLWRDGPSLAIKCSSENWNWNVTRVSFPCITGQ